MKKFLMYQRLSEAARTWDPKELIKGSPTFYTGHSTYFFNGVGKGAGKGQSLKGRKVSRTFGNFHVARKTKLGWWVLPWYPGLKGPRSHSERRHTRTNLIFPLRHLPSLKLHRAEAKKSAESKRKAKRSF